MKFVQSLFIYLSLLVTASVSQPPEPQDYSQMFMVCSPVYSRSDLQKILEKSINSLAFQIPVSPLQKAKSKNDFISTSKASDLNTVAPNVDDVDNKRSREIDSKFTTLPSSTKQPEPPTTYSATTTYSTESSTVQPISSTTTTTTTTTTPAPTTIYSTTTTWTTPSSTTSVSSTTTTASTTTPAASKPLRAIKPSNKRFYSSYYKQQHQQFVPNTAASSISTTDQPSIESNTKPALAKMRSRLFNLFQPRQFNSNILHKPRPPVDYPTIPPQSLFANTQNGHLNSLNSVVRQQQQPAEITTTTTTTTVKPTESKLIESSTESYPQTQSSNSPELNKQEQLNQPTTTTSSPVDAVSSEDKQRFNAQYNQLNSQYEKSKQIQPTNDNLLAVASSSRFHSVLNSNEERIVNNKSNDDRPDKKADQLSTIDSKESKSSNSDERSDERSKDKTFKSKQEAIITGPLKLEEIFRDFDEAASKNDTTSLENRPESSTVSSSSSVRSDDKSESQLDKQSSKESTKVTYDESRPTNVSSDRAYADHTQPTELSLIEPTIDENDGLIVRKFSDVIEIVDHKNVEIEDKNLDQSKDDHHSTRDHVPVENSPSKGQTTTIKESDSNKQSTVDRSDFIEIPTAGTVTDKLTESRSTNDKPIIEVKPIEVKPTDKLEDKSIDKLEDKPINDSNDKSMNRSADNSSNKSTDRTSDETTVRSMKENPITDRPMIDKSSDKAAEVTEVNDKLFEDKLVEDKSIVNDNYETTTVARSMNDDLLESAKYTYPINFMIE